MRSSAAMEVKDFDVAVETLCANQSEFLKETSVTFTIHSLPGVMPRSLLQIFQILLLRMPRSLLRG